MPDPSTIQIKAIEPDDTEHDLTPYVLFQTARFEYQANAIPGTFEFTVKDPGQELVFGSTSNSYAGINVGAEIYLIIDGVRQFGGILQQIDRLFAFPAVDTSTVGEVTARQFTLRGSDFNLWFDKRVIRDTNDYTRGIVVPGRHYDKDIIQNYLPDYLDVPPGVTFPNSTIEEIEEFGVKYNADGTFDRVTGWKMPHQGDVWRVAMERLAWRSGAVWYIDANKRVNFKSLERTEADVMFVDHNPHTVPPIQANSPYRVGCRAVHASQDGGPIVTDALVWGGLEELATGNNDGIFFGRYPRGSVDDDTEQRAVDARERYGRWQYAEINFAQGDDQISVNNRARAIVMGPPGTTQWGFTGGFHLPLWDITLTWFAHDLQGLVVHPGQVVQIMLYVMGHEKPSGQWVPLHQVLPLRTVSISFPQIPSIEAGQFKTWVQYDGQFGINYSDSRILWKFITRGYRRNTAASAGDYEFHGTVGATSTVAGFNAVGEFTLIPNGVKTVFNLQRSGPTNQAYLGSTSEVYLNGLLQRRGFEYEESDPSEGEITFYTAPHADDTLFVRVRTAGS